MDDSNEINNSSQSHSRYFVAFQLQRAFRAIGSFSQTQLGILDALARWCRSAEDAMTPTQSWLAAEAGVSDRTVRRTLTELVDEEALLRLDGAYRFGPRVMGACQHEIRACRAKANPDRRSASSGANPDRRSALNRIVGPPSSTEHLLKTPTTAGTMQMVFGKHRGELLSAIDADYLRWALTADKTTPALRAAIESELERRERHFEKSTHAVPSAEETEAKLARARAEIQKQDPEAKRRGIAQVHAALNRIQHRQQERQQCDKQHLSSTAQETPG